MHAVVAIINDNRGNILIGKKRSDSNKFLSGKWHIPGGGTKKDEDDFIALSREMKEETGIEIEVKRYLATSQTPTSRRQAKWYECFYVRGELTPGDDLEEAKWIPKSKVIEYCAIQATSLWPKEIMDYFSH